MQADDNKQNFPEQAGDCSGRGRLFDSECLFCLLQGYVRSPCVLFVSPAQALEQFQRVVTLEAARGSEVGRSLCKTYIESSEMFIGYRALCAVS